MGRPTVSLCCIMKNEEHNLPRFLASFAPAVDEIHLVDTGSTDKSIELVTQAHHSNKYGVPIYLHHFAWVNDFSKARNFAFQQATSDYVFWADLDDELDSAAKFLEWRKLMPIAEAWFATYVYGSTADGKPLCSFARERVVKRSCGFQWKYFVHEGLMLNRPDGSVVQGQYATAWKIVHKRSAEDMDADRTRNLKLFEQQTELDGRMTYYYGKELFENNKFKEAAVQLLKATNMPGLGEHDLVLTLQYTALAMMRLRDWVNAVKVSLQGLQLAPERAEFFTFIGDSLIAQKRIRESIPYYSAAIKCYGVGPDSAVQPAIYTQAECYTTWPRKQMVKAYAQLGDLNKAREVAEAAVALGDMEAVTLLAELDKVTAPSMANAALTPIDDILISCHPTGFYEWDEEIAKTTGVGGSEIAVIRMARELHKATGRRVMIFNNRTTSKVIDGVEYHSTEGLMEYAQKYLPSTHIAWRHNMWVTSAPTFLWCHDLAAQGIETQQVYEKVLALSPFHKTYLTQLFNIPDSKIQLTRNGIDPDRWEGISWAEKENRVVFSSSPDRGLEHALRVMDLVVQEVPDAKLYVYYGFGNMEKHGLGNEVKRLQAMLLDRSYVVYRGNTEQKELAFELTQYAKVWLYPTNFLETHCITALEMQASMVYPVVRNWGALPDTMAGMQADILDADCTDYEAYARATINALKENKWQACKLDWEKHSWARVAQEWLGFLPLSR